MPIPLAAIAITAGATALADIASNFFQSKANKEASEVQSGALQAGIDEQQRQFDSMQELLNPFVTAGQGALQEQQALTGQLGAEAQQQAIQGIQNSPEMLAMTEQGENAILQNASATGGLRGGNTQGALAQFRPQVLSSLINQRFSQLGGLSSAGLSAAGATGQAGMQTGANTANLLAQQGQADAIGASANSNMWAGVPSALTSGVGLFTGMGGFGTTPTPTTTTTMPTSYSAMPSNLRGYL